MHIHIQNTHTIMAMSTTALLIFANTDIFDSTN